MSLSSVDLNLLPLLHAVLETRSVKEAATRVSLSPSAASHALGRLRETLGDPLLVRAGRSMQLTPRAEALQPRVRRIVDELEAALRLEAVEPRQLRRSFTVGTTDYGEIVVVDPLGRQLFDHAPHVDLYSMRIDDALRLRGPGFDVAVGPYGPLPDDIGLQSLFKERFVCVMRRDHPAGRGRLTPARYASLDHLLVAPRGVPRGIVDRFLAEQGLQRRIARTVASFIAAPHLVAGSDLVLTVAERIARRFADSLDLMIRKPPLAVPGFTMKLAWPRRFEDDPSHRWLREQIVEVSRRIAG